MRLVDALVVVVLTVSTAAHAADDSYEAIVADAPHSSHDESCRRMERWVATHGSDERAGRGLIWMAQLRLADAERDEARRLFERALQEHPNTEWALHARKGLGDLSLEALRFDDALAAYAEVAASRDPFFQYVGRMALEDARAARLRFRLALAFLAVIIGAAALRLWRRRAQVRVWPAPVEVIYFAPMPVLLLGASLGQPAPEALAVRIVALGGALLLWTHGICERAQPSTGRWRWSRAAWGIVEAGTLFFLAICASGLWGKFADTLAMGAD